MESSPSGMVNADFAAVNSEGALEAGRFLSDEKLFEIRVESSWSLPTTSFRLDSPDFVYSLSPNSFISP